MDGRVIGIGMGGVKSLSAYEPYKVIYVDAMNLLSRCFYGITGLYYKGKSTGIFVGVFRFILDIVKRNPGIDLVFVWEGFDSWRKAKYPIYKSKRLNNPEEPGLKQDLFESVGIIQDILPFFRVTQLWSYTYEADDVVWTVSRKEDRKALYSSGDWDWWILADKGDILYQHREILSSSVMKLRFEKKFNAAGIEPDRLVLFKVLTGDPSDSVSGIPRFPKKVAAILCNNSDVKLKFGLDSFIKTLIFELRRLGLANWADKVLPNRWIIERNIDLLTPVDIPVNKIEKLNSSNVSEERMISFFEKYGLDRLLERLQKGGFVWMT